MVPSESVSNSPWITQLSVVAEPRLRMVCLPDVGEVAANLRDLVDAVPSDTEVFAVELPGHGLRRDESPWSSLDFLVDSVGHAVMEELLNVPTPLVFFGRGLGAVLAIEVTCWLEARGLPTPVRLLVGGATGEPPKLEAQLELGFVEALAKDGRFSDCCDRLSLGDVSVAGVRADLTLLGSWAPTNTVVDVPITVLADVGEEAVGFASVTTEGVHVKRVSGGMRVLGGQPLREALREELSLSGPPATCFHHVA